MIIYNKTWLDNLLIKQEFEEKLNKKLINEIEYKKIREIYKNGFSTSGIFARIGFGVLTLIVGIFSTGLLSLMFAELFRTRYFYFAALVPAAIAYFVLENFVRHKNYYKNGVDDVLLYYFTICTISFFNWALADISHGDIHEIMVSISVCILCLYLTLRFADMLMAVVTCASLLGAIFFSWKSIGGFGVATLPLAMMATSATLYAVIAKISDIPAAKYYRNCIITGRISALIGFYLSGNYFIVQNLGSRLNHLPADAKIPFGYIFWILTIIIPFVYLYFGIIKKDILFIRSALVLIAATVFTIRYYYHFISSELALILGGAVLITIVYLLIKYLKVPKNGFTYAQHNSYYLADKLNIESLIISQTAAHNKAVQHPDDRFGGGSFGGGGSSGNF